MVTGTPLDFSNYQFGFHKPENYTFKAKKGLTRLVVKEISAAKNEAEWLNQFRLKSLGIYKNKLMPLWGGNLGDIKFDDIYYYIRPIDKKAKSWQDLPREIRNTYDQIGLPEAEKKFLAGISAQYESEVVYKSIITTLTKKGVIFVDPDTAFKKYPEIFKPYFGTVIPPLDNKFAALNSAVFSGGSFIYVPKGVHVDLPLQAYFRINARQMGQFERTLIIADEGSFVHYVEGCFTKNTPIKTRVSVKPISQISIGDEVLTHSGHYQKTYHTQVRKYTGNLYIIKYYGNSTLKIEATEEHPILCVRRQRTNERNSRWKASWILTKELTEKDYILLPLDKTIKSNDYYCFDIEIGDVTKRFRPLKKERVSVPLTPGFFRLVGYYLAEGSIDRRGYLRFSFSSKERDYIEDVKSLVKEIFNHKKFHEFTYKDRKGIELVFSSVILARIFTSFGNSVYKKQIPPFMRQESLDKQKELIKGIFYGDGNYYRQKHVSGLKEIFRINTVSPTLAYQIRDMLLRLGIFAFINSRNRAKEQRKTMYTIGITGAFMKKFGGIVGRKVSDRINFHRRATMFYLDNKYAYVPIKSIIKKKVRNLDVYNFSVGIDESYTAGGVAVHNCTAPVYSTDSLHSAVVEIIVKKNARVRYTTIQNWSKNVYNLVTKRAAVYEEGVMEWVDANIGSKLTMKYPSVYLLGRGARGDILSLAYAGHGQHQDAGAKAIHIAPDTSSTIISKSISKDGGRTSYRGLLQIAPGAKNAKSNVRCDALIMDENSRSDTYPTMDVLENEVNVGHEATVSKVGEEQLFYLESRGLAENEAQSLIINGFIEPIVKELPMEYAVEMNRLIQLQMSGSVG